MSDSDHTKDTEEWYNAAATKQDVYYVAYVNLSAILMATGVLLIDTDPNASIAIVGISVLTISLATAVGFDGLNRGFWSKVIKNV